MVSSTHIRVCRLVNPWRICISCRASDLQSGSRPTLSSRISTGGMNIASDSIGMPRAEVRANAR